jgi:hypothetical protein
MIEDEWALVSSKPITTAFKKRGVENYAHALTWVHSLPYGRNRDRANYMLVLEELKFEYALQDIRKPIGVASYEVTLLEKLLKELKGSLPTVTEIKTY